MPGSEVVVKFVGDARQLRKSIDGIKQDSKGLGGGFANAAGSLKTMAVPALGAATAVFALATKAGDAADRLLDLEQITGVSTDKLQEMEHVAKIAGTEAEFYANSVNEVVKAMDRIERGTGPAAEALEKMQIATQNADGSMRSAEAITDDVISGLLGIEDASLRASLAEDIFKRKAQELIPVLALGEQGMNDAREAAHNLGIVQSTDALESANEFRIAMEELTTKLQAASLEMLQELLPILTDMVIPAVEVMADVVGRAKDGWEDFLGLFRGEIGDLSRIKNNIGGLNTELKNIEESGRIAGGGIRNTVDAVKSLAAEVRKATDPAFALRDAQDKMTDAADRVNQMRAAGDTKSDEFINALADEQEAMADLNYATEQYEAAGETATEGLFNLGEQAGQTREEIELLVGALEELNNTDVSVDINYRRAGEFLSDDFTDARNLARDMERELGILSGSRRIAGPGVT